MPGKPILEVEALKVHFPVYGGFLQREVGSVKAVDGISFSVEEGETLGLVGESGSGKSTVGKCVTMLERPTSGTISFGGRELQSMSFGDLRAVRKSIQMVFQDPYDSLNPRLSCQRWILRLHAKDEVPFHHAGDAQRMRGGMTMAVSDARAGPSTEPANVPM